MEFSIPIVHMVPHDSGALEEGRKEGGRGDAGRGDAGRQLQPVPYMETVYGTREEEGDGTLRKGLLWLQKGKLFSR